MRVTTPLGHTYDAEPPPLLGWGSLSFPPTTTAALPNESTATSDAVAASPEPTQGPTRPDAPRRPSRVRLATAR